MEGTSNDLTTFICAPVIGRREIAGNDGCEFSICFSLQVVDDVAHLLCHLREDTFVVLQLLPKHCYTSSSSSGFHASHLDVTMEGS
jgi:hypothetical protein